MRGEDQPIIPFSSLQRHPPPFISAWHNTFGLQGIFRLFPYLSLKDWGWSNLVKPLDAFDRERKKKKEKEKKKCSHFALKISLVVGKKKGEVKRERGLSE